eukprot:scaffold388_cov114-Cylindrotheca_fusiformis.AAC.17
MGVLLDILIVFSAFSFLNGGKSLLIQPKRWDYRGHDIAFEVSRRTFESPTNGTKDKSLVEQKDPILLLNGFGVGSFHQHRLIPEIIQGDESQVVYCIDYLGQGASWPKDCQDGLSDNEKGLIYSAATWIDQLSTFIEEIILPEHPNGRVHVIGNSVGGYLAAHLACQRPDLIRSICLLNPTPVWGLNLPGWSGHLPAPKLPRAIGRYLFDKIRELDTIEKYLDNAYARKEAYDEELMHQIRGCTLGAGGHAAFASILWSPPLTVSNDSDFQQCLSRVKCDVLLVFGAEDPWCKPAFGKRMLEALQRRCNNCVQRYVEIENCGHCPNHEAPQAVGKIVTSWVKAKDRREKSLSIVDADKEIFHEPWGETTIRERCEEDIKLSLLDRLAMTFV